MRVAFKIRSQAIPPHEQGIPQGLKGQIFSRPFTYCLKAIPKKKLLSAYAANGLIRTSNPRFIPRGSAMPVDD